MPYKRHKPISEEEMEQTEFDFENLTGVQEPVSAGEMNRHRYDGHRSVCQVIREIYRLTDNAEIRDKCRLAVAMTKAMHNQLKAYKLQEEERNGNPVK
jgi:hypothetical protein